MEQKNDKISPEDVVTAYRDATTKLLIAHFDGSKLEHGWDTIQKFDFRPFQDDLGNTTELANELSETKKSKVVKCPHCNEKMHIDIQFQTCLLVSHNDSQPKLRSLIREKFRRRWVMRGIVVFILLTLIMAIVDPFSDILSSPLNIAGSSALALLVTALLIWAVLTVSYQSKTFLLMEVDNPTSALYPDRTVIIPVFLSLKDQSSKEHYLSTDPDDFQPFDFQTHRQTYSDKELYGFYVLSNPELLKAHKKGIVEQDYDFYSRTIDWLFP